MTFLLNLFSILRNAPAIIAIIKAMMDVIGSEQVQKFLESFRDALKKEVPSPDAAPKTEPERIGLLQRISRRWALSALDMSESEYRTFCNTNKPNNFTV